jgi:hypothetical protein
MKLYDLVVDALFGHQNQSGSRGISAAQRSPALRCAGLRPIRQGRLVAGHHATVIGTDVEPADVVGHFTVPCKEALFQT